MSDDNFDAKVLKLNAMLDAEQKAHDVFLDDLRKRLAEIGEMIASRQAETTRSQTRNIVEAVAKNLGRAMAGGRWSDELDWRTDRGRHRLESLARIAIGTMRRPTPEMCEAGLMAGPSFESAWIAMIDEVLK